MGTADFRKRGILFTGNKLWVNSGQQLGIASSEGWGIEILMYPLSKPYTPRNCWLVHHASLTVPEMRCPVQIHSHVVCSNTKYCNVILKHTIAMVYILYIWYLITMLRIHFTYLTGYAVPTVLPSLRQQYGTLTETYLSALTNAILYRPN